MDDFTKIKLINSLIDAVNHFYDLKQKVRGGDQKHLKGFCEGLAYALVKIEAVDSNEAKKILQGLGKKREYKKLKAQTIEPKEEKKETLNSDDLEIPTIFRKGKI